jgi:hypothetical protein
MIPTGAQRVLRAAVTIGSVDPHDLLPALEDSGDTAVDGVREVLAEIRELGWIEPGPDGRDRVVESARVWLVHDLPDHTDPGDVGGAHRSQPGRAPGPGCVACE